MNNILNAGIIGAGSISDSHIVEYISNPATNVVAISDVNKTLAKDKAEKYGIPFWYNDYKQLLADKSIAAVSICTPTFTHCNIVIDALNAGKHVLCEKPPALNATEVEKCVETARKNNKLLMYGFVCRFKKEITFLKDKIASGTMGNIYYAEASRIMLCYKQSGWFMDKSLAGGGILMDGAIHELDEVLYLMGYPKVKTVLGYTTDINNNLPEMAKGLKQGWSSINSIEYKRTIESMASGMATFENGACLQIKAGSVLMSTKTGDYISIYGEKAGACLDENGLNLISIDENGYFIKSTPVLNEEINIFAEEINHFAQCCLNGIECICKPSQIIMLMKLLDAIYLSAEKKCAIEF